MTFVETPIGGVVIIELEPRADARGFFARSWCADEFLRRGLNPRLAQCNVSFNERRGTLRGLHYQVAPHEESKLIRCTMGALHDVAVDLRPGSPTRGQSFSVELTAENRRMFYIPEGVAHGFQTLADATEVFYQMSASYHPESARGIRWNDPTLAIRWPLADPIVAEIDLGRPFWTP